MKHNLFLSISSILLLASCGNSNPNGEVKNNVAGFETGIQSVELSTVYSGSESAELWNSISSALDKVTSANLTNYTYRLSSNMVNETSITENASLSFFGTDKQYAVADIKTESVETVGKAVTSKSTTSSKSEYASGDKGKITYIKNSYVSASGKETTAYSHNYSEAGGANIRRTQLSGLASGRFSGGVLGSTKDGKLYYVYYFESSNRETAYNSDGEAVRGLNRTCYHILFDLNSVSKPQYNAIYSITITESNIDNNGIKSDSFHVTSKTSLESIFHYETITEAAEKRTGLIASFPEETVRNLRVMSYRNGSQYNLLDLLQDPRDETKYTGNFSPSLSGYQWSFHYIAARYLINKQNETVTTGALYDHLMPITSSTLIRGQYPEEVATIDNNSITLNRPINLRLSFQSSMAVPYLSVTSIELL